MSHATTGNGSGDDLDELLGNLTPPPPVFAPRGLSMAAQIVFAVSTHAPDALAPPLRLSTQESLLNALHKSAHSNEPSGPLLPRHSHSIEQLPSKKPRVSLYEMSDDWCRLATRLETKADLVRVRTCLEIPDRFTTTHREIFTGDEALAVLLSRIAYPCRLSDLADKWGRSGSAISRCVSELGLFIFTRWRRLLEFNPRFHSQERLDHYAACISAAGSPLEDIWGFIDCTIIEMCRPKENQDIVYNGYKKHHALKYQAVVTPDGFLCPVYGPVEGRRADGGLLEMSGLGKTCHEHAVGTDGRQLFVYGDPAYGLSDTVISGVKKMDNLTTHEQEFNQRMSKLRQSVEWGFGGVSTNFAFADYPKSLRLGLQPVGRLYLLSVLFTNIRASMYPSEISTKFQCSPPSLENYLSYFE